MEEQESLIKLGIIEQESQMLEQKIQEIDNQIIELNAVKESLSELDGKKEILANLGKGIFIKANVKEDKLLVNVGQGILVKKTAKETIEVIDEENKKLLAGKENMILKIQELQEKYRRIMQEENRNQKQNK